MKLQNSILEPSVLEKRRYDDACAAAHGMDLLGERWSLLVMRELMMGPRRFTDLRSALPGISANILTQRLEGLEANGVIFRRKLPPPAAVWVYELTTWGYEAEPIMQAIGRWAARSPMHDPSRPFSAVSMMLSLRTMLDANRARSLATRVGFRFGEDQFVGRLAAGHLAIRREEPNDVAFCFDTTPAMLAAVTYGGLSIEAAEETGDLCLSGDRGLAHRFVGLFPLPEKATRPPA